MICLWALVTDRWGVAAVAGTLAVIAYVMAPQEAPPTYGLDHEFAIDSREFLTSVAGTTGVPFLNGNRVDILDNGDRFFPAMLDAIRRAERSVTIEAYIYWAGGIGEVFAAALAERARAGVPVKILLDAVGSSSIGPEILHTLKQGGCRVAWYNPIHWYTIGRFNNRTHRKSLIVDGTIAFTGGAGIADPWLGDAQDPDHWRDLQIRIEGPAAMLLQTGFAQNWLQTTGEMVSGIAFFPPPLPAGSTAVQMILSSPRTGASAARIMYYLSIVCARRSIHIANPYFVPDVTAIETLLEASRRGVDVKIMVAGRYNDIRVARHNSVRLYGLLLEDGIEIYEYNRTMLHQKTMVVDGRWATVGTTNFDNRSFALSDEANACFYEPALVRHLQEIFLADLAHCDRVDLETWRRRGLRQRVLELGAAVLRDQV